MATTTTAPAFKAGLKTLLDTEAADNSSALFGVQVSYGYPGDTIERSSFWLGDITADIEYAAIRGGPSTRKPRDERYSIEIMTVALRPGESIEAAETKAFEYLSTLEDLIAANPALTTAGIRSANVATYSTEAVLAPEGGRCAITGTVDVKARLN